MDTFKFFQKPIVKYDVYEQKVLNIIGRCHGNNINPIGYSHPFSILTLEGIKHKRIVIRNITKLRSDIVIAYTLHIQHVNEEDTVIRSTFGIYEDEYRRLIEQYEGI